MKLFIVHELFFQLIENETETFNRSLSLRPLTAGETNDTLCWWADLSK